MKKVIKGLIVFFMAAIIGLTALLIAGITMGEDSIPFLSGWEGNLFEGKMINTQSVSIDGITKLSLECNSDDVIIKSTDEDEITIKEYISNQSPKRAFLTVTNNGSNLSIKADKNNNNFFIFFGSNRRYFEIYLPDSYEGDWDIVTSSGDVMINVDLECADFRAEGSSSEVTVEKIKADNIKIRTSSGDIYADTLDGKKELHANSGCISLNEVLQDTTIVTSSGDIVMRNVSGKLDLDTSSGDITVDSIAGSAKTTSSSGDVRLYFNELHSNLNITTSSGNVNCTLPQDISFKFEANTGSGDINTHFDNSLSYNKKGNHVSGTVGSNDNIDITITTSSGDIKILD